MVSSTVYSTSPTPEHLECSICGHPDPLQERVVCGDCAKPFPHVPSGKTDYFDPLATPVASFPEPESVGPREWGTEELLVLANHKYMMKRITMKAGAEGGLQYHRKKDEAGYMIYGIMRVVYDDGTGTLVTRDLRPGTSFHFPNGCIHKSVAITECQYIECGTPHFNDRVHVEEEYGAGKEAGGLPSTALDDIIER